MEEKFSLIILDYLRRHPITIIADLLEVFILRCGWTHNGKPRTYQGHSADNYFLKSLEALATEEIIIIDNDEFVNNEENIYHNKKYPLDTKITLTNKLASLQHTLGFSLTELVDKYLHGKNINVRPIWGCPDKIETDVFVIMPFNEDFNSIYNDHIKKVCTKMSLSCKRADDIFTSQSVIRDIWNHIYNTKVVICDCTNKNPNVFYELGIAHAVGKNVILVTQSINDIPFDIKQFRFIKYKFTPRGMSDFESALERFIYDVNK